MTWQRNPGTGRWLKLPSGRWMLDCCCCVRCTRTIGGVPTDLGCACKYRVTFSGLTGDYAPYNGEHIMSGHMCVWYGTALTVDGSFELWHGFPPDNDGAQSTVFVQINDTPDVTFWVRTREALPACGIVGTYTFGYSDGPSQSAATCVVSEY